MTWYNYQVHFQASWSLICHSPLKFTFYFYKKITFKIDMRYIVHRRYFREIFLGFGLHLSSHSKSLQFVLASMAETIKSTLTTSTQKKKKKGSRQIFSSFDLMTKWLQ